MADGEPTGPRQMGRGVQGQYVYWVCMAHPKPETVGRLRLKVPSDFSREAFSDLMIKAHRESGITIVETAVFLALAHLLRFHFLSHAKGCRRC